MIIRTKEDAQCRLMFIINQFPWEDLATTAIEQQFAAAGVTVTDIEVAVDNNLLLASFTHPEYGLVEAELARRH